ncbi:magnesium transporter [Anaerocolumna aminovalerica]|uniref:Magnesium transporter MgtE n=1 Tax=Anaerocolumna aminovalerica TaxID=1527 RepID=A0A1I5F840_9FIRM|nr:magnesium transporter [Anaerocolumna aminovalerica]SFO19809.1 magnesium transporter [Anaerocolumna aminovalerica]
MTNIELLTLLEENKLKLIHEELSKYNPVDLASLLSKLDEEKLVIVFRILDKEKAAEAFSYMENDLQQTLIKTLSKQDIKTIFNSMYADDAVDFLSDMPANVVTQLLENVDNETRADINYLLQYSEDSAGSIMTVEFIELHPTMTVKQALDKIRKVGIDSETVYTCYVVVKHKLLGIVSAKDLMIRDSETLISDLMKDNYVSIKTTDDRETAANLFRKYGLLAIPVVDSEGCIVGIVTFDDAIDVLTDETTEDMQKMAAMTANDDPYLKTSVWKHAKHRIVWLLILMFSATITGSIISNYESAFAIIPLLVSFIPMLMDTGGNCGSQSSTLVIRGLAVEELQFSDTLKIVWKEFRVSLIVGVTLAVANGLRIVLMYKDIQLALVVSLSLVGTIIIAKIVGCLLPILAKKCKLDPAIMAAPIITTVVDTFSIIIYFNIATLIFKL